MRICSTLSILTGCDLFEHDFVLVKYLGRVSELSEKHRDPGLAPVWRSIGTGSAVTMCRAYTSRDPAILKEDVVEEPMRMSICHDMVDCLAA